MFLFHEIMVIGAGASGIMASITVKDNGKDVGILESKKRIGQKLLSTGNGRCNITNENINYSRYHSKNPDFFKDTLDNFTLNDTVTFLIL